jgi:hypothetical protein
MEGGWSYLTEEELPPYTGWLKKGVFSYYGEGSGERYPEGEAEGGLLMGVSNVTINKRN